MKLPSKGDHSFYDNIKDFKRFRSSTPTFLATSTEFGEGSPTIKDYLAKKGNLEVSSTPLSASTD